MDRMTTRQVNAELMIAEVLSEQAEGRMREREWLRRAAVPDGNNLTVIGNAENNLGGDLDAGS
jgi:hypothetical protein